MRTSSWTTPIIIAIIVIVVAFALGLFNHSSGSSITPKQLDDWFRDRIIPACVIAILIGVTAALVVSSSVRNTYGEDINVATRREFCVLSAWMLTVAFLVLIIDCWRLYQPFRGFRLSFLDVISVAVNVRSFALLRIAIPIIFLIAAMVFKSAHGATFSGRYAFWLGPRVK